LGSSGVMDDGDFHAFVAEVRPRLARVFIAMYGQERGQEALAEAMAYAWEHFEELCEMRNPAGYLYRVGQSRSRPRRGDRVLFPSPADVGLPAIEPGLPAALGSLSERQRVCVALVHALGWTHQEAADLLGLSRSSVQNHVERGLDRLRQAIGVFDDA
jgi:DNA-directed RNA polymerase specialized sigma24 family protein